MDKISKQCREKSLRRRSVIHGKPNDHRIRKMQNNETANQPAETAEPSTETPVEN